MRALAVIPVILFHAGFEWFRGGYVGVDVFFVISGYLITSIILEELEAGKFTLAGFYERRARRILPALFFIMLICLPLAWIWMLPFELESFGASLAAVAVFASNILFWLKTDYFAATSEQIPLLHTWSLAVEEQYYLLFPLFMLLVWNHGKRWLTGLLVFVAVVSLAWSEWLWRHSIDANFYLIPGRAWELMLGALTALYVRHNPFPQGWLAQLAGVIGLGLLAYAVLVFDEGIPFPSLYALVPTIGAVLLILFATDQTVIGKLLSCRVLVGIGLISYSAYLWHQPLFVFARMLALDEPNRWLMGGLSVLALLLAWFSWRFVEKPWRNRNRFTRRQVFSAAIIGSIFFIALGGWFVVSEGLAERFAQ